MTDEDAAGRDIVDLDARAVRPTVGVVAAGERLPDQIVGMLGRSPAWPRRTTELR